MNLHKYAQSTHDNFIINDLLENAPVKPVINITVTLNLSNTYQTYAPLFYFQLFTFNIWKY